MINCEQHVASIMRKLFKMRKKIMESLSWKVAKLTGFDQTQIIMLYLFGKLHARSKLFGLTKY